MYKRSNKEFLLDINEAINRIEKYITGINYEQFLEKTEKQDAVIRNLEIIGEAVKNLTNDFKSKYKDIEWKEIAGMRDKIIHFYFGVNWDIVWKAIKNKLPTLKEKTEKILEESEK